MNFNFGALPLVNMYDPQNDPVGRELMQDIQKRLEANDAFQRERQGPRVVPFPIESQLYLLANMAHAWKMIKTVVAPICEREMELARQRLHDKKVAIAKEDPQEDSQEIKMRKQFFERLVEKNLLSSIGAQFEGSPERVIHRFLTWIEGDSHKLIIKSILNLQGLPEVMQTGLLLAFDSKIQNVMNVVRAASAFIKSCMVEEHPKELRAEAPATTVVLPENPRMKKVLTERFRLLHRIHELREEPEVALRGTAAILHYARERGFLEARRPFQTFETTLKETAPLALADGVSAIMAQFEFTLSQAIEETGGDIRKLPPDWKEKLHDAQALTLRRVDMDYEKLEALARECPRLQEITLEEITCNGSPHFDKSVILHFFAGKEKPPTILGAPCSYPKEWLHLMMHYHEDLGLSKKALWTLYIELHQEQHQAVGKAIHDPIAGQQANEEDEQAVETFLGTLSQKMLQAIREAN